MKSKVVKPFRFLRIHNLSICKLAIERKGSGATRRRLTWYWLLSSIFFSPSFIHSCFKFQYFRYGECNAGPYYHIVAVASTIWSLNVIGSRGLLNRPVKTLCALHFGLIYGVHCVTASRNDVLMDAFAVDESETVKCSPQRTLRCSKIIVDWHRFLDDRSMAQPAGILENTTNEAIKVDHCESDRWRQIAEKSWKRSIVRARVKRVSIAASLPLVGVARRRRQNKMICHWRKATCLHHKHITSGLVSLFL